MVTNTTDSIPPPKILYINNPICKKEDIGIKRFVKLRLTTEINEKENFD